MSLTDRSRPRAGARLARAAALALLPAALAAPRAAAAQCVPDGTLRVIDPPGGLPLSLRWAPDSPRLSRQAAVKNFGYIPLTLVVGETTYGSQSQAAGVTNFLSVGGSGTEVAGGGTTYAMGASVNTDALRNPDGTPRNGSYDAFIHYWIDSRWGRNVQCLQVFVTVDFPTFAAPDTITVNAETVSPTSHDAQFTLRNNDWRTLRNQRTTVVDGMSWIKTFGEAYDIERGNSRIVYAFADVRGKAPGTYYGKLKLTADGGAIDKYVTVKVKVAGPPPALTFARQSLLLSMQVNALAAKTGTLDVRETHGGSYPDVVPTIAYGPGATGWLSATMYGGPVSDPRPSTYTPGWLALRAGARGLAAGVYTATINAIARGATPAAPATVTLEVIDLKAAQGALADPARLPEAERLRLDALGNKDGVYNLGDYQALRTRLGLP